MKYYTKEWSLSCEKLYERDENRGIIMSDNMVRRYRLATRDMSEAIPRELKEALIIYDSQLVASFWDGTKYVLKLRPDGMSDTLSMTFDEILEMHADDDAVGGFINGVETYVYDGVYEVHILSASYEKGRYSALGEIVVRAKRMEYEMMFRNFGKCEECGRRVADPTMEGYPGNEPSIDDGRYEDGIWWCDVCRAP